MEFIAGDWKVTIEGAEKMPMRAWHELYEGVEICGPLLARLVKSHNLKDWNDLPVTFLEQRTTREKPGPPNKDGTPGKPTTVEDVLITNVSGEQLKWLRQCVQEAAKNELLDPEA
jgi:hypothetical protein